MKRATMTAWLTAVIALGAACTGDVGSAADTAQTRPSTRPAGGMDGGGVPDDRLARHQGETARAIFAGGCFWCMEPPFEKLDGVLEVVSGYTGGEEVNPTYKEVSSGRTGHREAVRVTYDPSEISYERLLKVFWRSIDPTDAGGQFADRGSQYETGIFYGSEEERRLAEASKRELARSGKFSEPIVTEILPEQAFYPAEQYHQDYYIKNPEHYKRYKIGSGREGFLQRTWGDELQKMSRKGVLSSPPGSWSKPSDEELRERLTPMQYKVTQQEGTEPPYRNEYWDNKKEGIYVDVVSGEPLFSSKDKFRSGTGWPSFTKPLEGASIVEKTDYLLGYPRTEVRSRMADSHLGHVFEDGPAPTGLRYCINSAALEFIPSEELEERGYGELARLFEGSGSTGSPARRGP